MTERRHVLVVGAGIVGASIAWHLARASVRVTVVEAGEPGGLATRNSWGWINASWGNKEAYFRLRMAGMAEWRRLEKEIPEIRVAWVGGLLWELPPRELDAFTVEHAAWGYDIRRVDRAEARRIEPKLMAPPDVAVHAACEGAVEPLAVTRTLLASAERLGATVLANTLVRSIDLAAGRVAGIEMESGRLEADQVVVAAGAGSVALAATAGLALPVSAPAALLVVTRPQAKLLNGLIMTPDMQLRQAPDGRLIAAAGLGATASSGDAAAELVEAMKGMFEGGASLALESHVTAPRPMPRGGLPIVGRVAGIGGLYVGVTHSGVTLAPAIGRFLAEEILTGQRHPLLAPYGPERFKDAA